MTDDSTIGQIFAGSGILFIGLGFELGISFVIKIFIARYLGRVDFGAITVGMTVMTIAATVVLIGLHTGVARYLPRVETDKERNGIIVSAVQIVLPLSLIAAAGVILSAEQISRLVLNDSSLSWLIILFAIGIPFNSVFKLAVGVSRGRESVLPRVFLQNIGYPALRFVLLVAIVLLGLGLSGVAVATVGGYVIIAAISLWYIWNSLIDFRTSGYERFHRELLSFSLPLLVTAAMLLILSKIDVLLIGYFTDPGLVGDYNAAYSLATLLLVVLRSFQFLFMPKISGLHSEGEYSLMDGIYSVVSKWVFIISLPPFALFMLFPKEVITLSFGIDYVRGWEPLMILAMGFVVHTALGPNGTTLTSIGKTRQIMYDNIFAAVVNVVLNILLIPRLGILGAAIATAVSYISVNLLYSTQLYRSVSILPFESQNYVFLYLFVILSTALFYAVNNILSVVPRIAILGLFTALILAISLSLSDTSGQEIELIEFAEERTGVKLDLVRGVLRRFE